jgi:hypothetical protein
LQAEEVRAAALPPSSFDNVQPLQLPRLRLRALLQQLLHREAAPYWRRLRCRAKKGCGVTLKIAPVRVAQNAVTAVDVPERVL